MSFQVNNAFVQQYAANVGMLLQQGASRLRSSVQTYSLMGKAASVLEQVGAVSPVRNMARHADTPLISTPHDKRWAYPADYDWADLIDSQDKLRTLIDPQSSYVKAGAAAMGRAIDDEIISAFFNANNTGENGTTSTGTLYAFGSNSQSVPAVTGAAAATGLNISKLRRAKRILMASDMDVDTEELYCVITARQHDDLLNEAQAISLDYNTKPVLVDGRIRSFMGFNFVISERIPGGANFNTAINPAITAGGSDGNYTTGSRWMVPCYAKSGVALGVWNDIQTTIDRRADKRNATQVYVTGTFGSTRLEEKRCVIINCV